ncbi:MAG: hypothetical protein WCC51_03145 [Stenotrophomonas indicatrix]
MLRKLLVDHAQIRLQAKDKRITNARTLYKITASVLVAAEERAFAADELTHHVNDSLYLEYGIQLVSDVPRSILSPDVRPLVH